MPATWNYNQGKIQAFIDLGTNSARLLLVRLNPNGSFRILSDQKEAVRLGEGEFNGHNELQPEAMQRAALVCKNFASMARSYGADDITAVATAATREASNQGEFLRIMRREARLDMRVVSGREEARLIYLGIANNTHLEDKQALFIDIGGGSTEIIIGEQHQYHFLDSLKLGAIRVTTTFFLPDESGTVSPERYEAIKDYARNHAIRAIQKASTYHIEVAYGSSGTIENLADIAVHEFYHRSRQRDDVLTFKQLKQIAKMLCTKTLEERRQVPGINSNRADIIIAGAAVLETIMEALKIEEIRITDRGLRDGLLFDWLAERGLVSREEPLSVRERSVLQLGRACGFDEDHARRVTELALSLYDSGREIGLHKYGKKQRELLRYAALLHDIGAFLSYSNHQAHTYYLIRNADLLGFDQNEVKLIATAALFHRRPMPKRKKHPEYAELSKPNRRLIRVFSLLLRLAESLDRSHLGNVGQARFRLGPDGSCILEMYGPQNHQLELWGVLSHRRAFRKVFKRDLEVSSVIVDKEDEPIDEKQQEA